MRKGHRLTYRLMCESGVDAHFTVTVPDSMEDSRVVMRYVYDVARTCHKHICPHNSSCGTFNFLGDRIEPFGYSKEELERMERKGKFSGFN